MRRPGELENVMALTQTLNRQAQSRNMLAERVRELSHPENLRRYIYGSLPEYGGKSVEPERCRLSVVQNDGTGAATVECITEDSIRVFAKIYPDASGQHSHRVLSTLWSDGFGPSSRFRVSEPLAFYPELNMLVTRGAEGLPVASAQSEAEMAEGAREAARWLASLHTSELRLGAVAYPWEVFHKLTRRLAKAAAQHPKLVDEMIAMLDRFEQIAARFQLRLVQTHGQFRHIHVFLADAVTVIDLDRSRPADPGKDLGEFLHRMRTHRFKETGGASRAEEATSAFLDEYASRLPENLDNLPFYWCYHTLVSLWRFAKSHTPDDPLWPRMNEFYLSEFELAAGGVRGD
jgi:Phosphotransferase enzyme family